MGVAIKYKNTRKYANFWFFYTSYKTYGVHFDLALGFKQDPTDGHTHEVWSESGPWFVINLVEHSQRVVNTAGNGVRSFN